MKIFCSLFSFFRTKYENLRAHPQKSFNFIVIREQGTKGKICFNWFP